MGHLERRGGVDPAHPSGQQTEALASLALLARLEEELEAETDPEHRAAALRRLPDRVAEPGAEQERRRRGEGADAREHHRITGRDHRPGRG